MDFGTSQSHGHSAQVPLAHSSWAGGEEKYESFPLNTLSPGNGEFVATHTGRAFPGDSWASSMPWFRPQHRNSVLSSSCTQQPSALCPDTSLLQSKHSKTLQWLPWEVLLPCV